MGKRKSRADFRKKHQGRVRRGDLTREFKIGDEDGLADAVQSERLSGKGKLTRKKTVAASDGSSSLHDLKPGRVLSVHGPRVRVLGDDGVEYECAVRQVLKSLNIDSRTAVVAGDVVRFRAESEIDGMIEHVEPRRGVICRTSRGRQHMLAANIDYLLIIASLARPTIKPALIDRFLLTAAQCEVTPVIVLNKADLIDAVDFQPLMGNYASLGFRVLMTSAESGLNVAYLRSLLIGKQTVLAGQSGVGKSSLLNAVQPGLGLAVGVVSEDNDKGKHTTTASRMIPLDAAGAVFDTPGIRQFELWDIEPAEVGGLMPDFRPYVSGCRYTDCLHLAEDQCAVKHAVADGRISDRRYDAYCHLLETDLMVESY